MAYDNERKKYNKIPFQFVEIEVDAVVTRFYDYDYGEVISGFSGYPALKSFSMSPAQININGGIGIRATAQASIGEVMDYTVNGTLSAPVRYWAAWTAKNRDYRYQRISHYSGYIVNGKYDAANFIQRDFLIENMSWGADGVSFSLRDPLMLANDDKAQLPLESTGILSADISSTTTAVNITPAGVGDLEYPASNFYIIINEEVMLCTSRTADALTVDRGEYGTEAALQSFEAKVQLCLWFDDATMSDMGYHLFTVGAGVPTSYIDKPVWDARSENAFPNVYNMLITKPTGVRTLLKEICDSAPHYYYYDTRSNQIQFKPQEAPQDTGQILTYEENLLMGKTVVTDRKDLQITTVVIYFDIRNPVKDIKETSNYAKVYVREDTAAVLANGGVRQYKTIFSRCIGSSAKSAAVLAAALTGRRFAVAPIQMNYELDPKDSEVWTGDAVRVKSDLVLNATTLLPDLRNYQVISANENVTNQRFNYTVLEHTYGAAVSGDEDVSNSDTRLVYISGLNDQLRATAGGAARTLREYYDDTYGDIASGYDVRFIIEVGAVAGSSAGASISTGAWPELTTPPIIINYNLLIGRGGSASGDGGVALSLDNDIRLSNLGTIGGGGGGGGSFVDDVPDFGNGGGGAGYVGGLGGGGQSGEETSSNTVAGFLLGGAASPFGGGDGGDLGQDGSASSQEAGGLAGAAINLNGFVITYVNTGTIIGSVS